MAVVTAKSSASADGRKLWVGANVLFMTLVAIGLVGALQYLGVSLPMRWDMTSSALNSLSDGSENLVRGLDKNVRLTSLYFKTDLEEEDQQRYRQAVENLLTLYESNNRSKVRAEWINPLSDLEKMKELMGRMRTKTAYKDDIEKYKAHIETFKTLEPQIATLLQAEVSKVRELTTGAMGESPERKVLSPIESLCTQLSGELDSTREQALSFSADEEPQYSAAISEIKRLYRTMTDRLKKLADYANGEVTRGGTLSAGAMDYLKGIGGRSSSLVTSLEDEAKKLDTLEPLKLDNVLRELRPNGNPILVETDEEAMIVDFENVFPAVDPNAVGRVGFSRRAFKGEEQLTSAILRITHKEQTAIVFVRYGGSPLFFGGMPGRGGAPYMQMKKQLEDANFVVEEWDLKASTELPKIDPAPTKMIFVVLKPTPPERNPMMGQQQPPDPPFAEPHRQALLKALGEHPRAMFIAGWEPTPGMNPMQPMPMPSSYEYNDYLKSTWGVSVDTAPLLVQFGSIAPGKYMPTRQNFFSLEDVVTGDHAIVQGAHSRLVALPFCAPLTMEKTPDGVKLEKLIWQPAKDGVWGIKSLQKYQEQQNDQEYLTKVEGDLEGPFDLAVAGTKDGAKMVLISSRDFAEDSVAFARQMAMTAEGLTLRNANPGNSTLFINSMHWLNDNTQFLNIGKPIDAAVLAVDPKAETKVKVATIVLWPALALLCGGVAWWIRRR